MDIQRHPWVAYVSLACLSIILAAGVYATVALWVDGSDSPFDEAAARWYVCMWLLYLTTKYVWPDLDRLRDKAPVKRNEWGEVVD